MDSRKVMLMAGALVFAAVCAVLARSMFGGSAAPEAAANAPVASGPEILVATRSLPAGTIVTADAFRAAPWPKELVDKAYYTKGAPEAEKLIGTVVRLPIPAGQPLTQGSLVKPGDRGFLAAALSPGMRAVTIPISAQSGVAGFVFPGDRVDLLLTQTVTGGGDGPPLKATETIVRNLRVLATDQRTDKTIDEQGKTQVATFSMVTVEVTPKLSEKMSVAQTIGSLSLALRPIADDRMELERAIASGDIDVPATVDPKAEKAMLLQLATHPIDTNTSVSTGGEVSRFQRSSVPPKSDAMSMTSMTSAPAAPPAMAVAAAAPRPRGPTVTVMRGQAVSEVPVRGF